ncbi:hypothetical protein BC833DRAFT_254797 [Globomyces pollinis-pini]|nr:hypothetical protein BC833DRAFT_254797 [Globomyces pollinis-pini]
MIDNPSFLFDICDFHLNYIGCDNLDSLLLIDSIFIGLHAIELLFCLFYMWKAKMLNNLPNLKDFEIAVILGSIHAILRMSQLSNNSSLIHLDKDLWTNSDIVRYVLTNTMIDMFIWTFAGLTANQFVKSMVFAASGAHLYDKIKIKGKIVDPTKGLTYFRILVLLVNIILFVLLITKGIHGTRTDFIWYRRGPYVWLGILSGIVSPTILHFFGGKVIKKLKSNKTKIDLNNQSIITWLERCIYFVIFFAYWPIVFCCFCFIYINENIPSSTTLLIIKIFTEFSMWFGPTCFLGLLIQRLLVGQEKRNVSNT